MTSQTLRWSRESYGLKDFAEILQYQLPVLVKVTQGYCGIDDSKYTFCMDDVYHISHINSQRRIVTRDSTGRMLSIPEDYPVKFKIKGSPKAAQRFLEMFRDQPFEPGIQVIPAEKNKLSFCIGADEKMKTGIATLELVDRFKDRYLVGNPVITGTMYEPAVHIPLFIGIRVALAEGVKVGAKEEYKTIIERYKAETMNYKNETVTGNPEIMLYENDHQQSEGEYMYLEPKTYISCAELAALKGQYQQLPPATPSGTPAAPPAENEYRYVAFQNTEQNLKPKPPKKPDMPVEQQRPPNDDYCLESAVDSKTTLDPETSSKSQTSTLGQKADTPPIACCYDTLEKVPESMEGVTTQGVADCLKLIKMGKYAETFIDNDIDGNLLLELELSILVQDLGMSKLEATKLHMFVHEKWRPKK